METLSKLLALFQDYVPVSDVMHTKGQLDLVYVNVYLVIDWAYVDHWQSELYEQAKLKFKQK